MRLIDADALLIHSYRVVEYDEAGFSMEYNAVSTEEIKNAPTIEAVPVVRGEWIKTFRYMRENVNTGKIEPVYSCDCPICKYHTGNQGQKFNFCPNCGADMRGEKNE